MTIEELAALVLEQTRATLAWQYSQAQADAQQVAVVPGRKYAKIDRGRAGGMSGYLMIENATGVIYGIKAYGVPHKGHCYGTLATVGEWFWGEYAPQRAA